MLASVYSYRVMVKSVSSCCVRGRWVLSNPVTFGVKGKSKQHVHKLFKALHKIGLKEVARQLTIMDLKSN